jgi:hypothetical protein
MNLPRQREGARGVPQGARKTGLCGRPINSEGDHHPVNAFGLPPNPSVSAIADKLRVIDNRPFTTQVRTR